jgi:hypothetical protein
MKELTSGSSASGAAPELKKASEIKGCAKTMTDAASQQASVVALS